MVWKLKEEVTSGKKGQGEITAELQEMEKKLEYQKRLLKLMKPLWGGGSS
jgi:hypothetical protein